MIAPDLLLANETLNALATHVAVIDRTGTILFVNEAWRLFARQGGAPAAADGYLGANYLAVCEDAVRAGDALAGEALAGIERVLGLARDRFVLEYPCATPAEEYWFRMSVTRTPGPGGHVVVAHDDITAQKRAEGEREAMLREQTRLRLEALEANQMKDDFIAVLSHELRTPLQAVLGWATILKGGIADPAVAERATSAIERNARLQATLLEETLELSRLARGKLALAVEDIDLSALLADVAESVRPSAADKGVDLEQDVPGERVIVQGDAMRLRQVFWNLLSNAIKFTPAGGRIRVRTRAADGWITIGVHDSGIGIQPDLMPRLFNRFSQGRDTLGRPLPGLGLGLAIVSELVVAHGGTITVESGGEGQGATFSVRLLLARSEQLPDASPR
jgi:signal transduction histidine kinase